MGAGGFVRSTHLPNLQRESGVRITAVVSRGGSSAASLARSLNGARAGTDWQEALDAPDVDLVFIATRHDTHAEIAAAALRAGKAVFVEKPLGLTREQIDDVWAASDATTTGSRSASTGPSPSSRDNSRTSSEPAAGRRSSSTESARRRCRSTG